MPRCEREADALLSLQQMTISSSSHMKKLDRIEYATGNNATSIDEKHQNYLGDMIEHYKLIQMKGSDLIVEEIQMLQKMIQRFNSHRRDTYADAKKRMKEDRTQYFKHHGLTNTRYLEKVFAKMLKASCE